MSLSRGDDGCGWQQAGTYGHWLVSWLVVLKVLRPLSPVNDPSVDRIVGDLVADVLMFSSILFDPPPSLLLLCFGLRSLEEDAYIQITICSVWIQLASACEEHLDKQRTACSESIGLTVLPYLLLAV